MHELSITENILQIATQHAEQASAESVTQINLVIGQLASIVDDSVQFYWDIISQGTICQGAQLHFERIPAVLQCLDCNQSYTLQKELMPCPKCGNTHIKVIKGEEFWVDSIEIQNQTEIQS
jgi:hydrogenase nickel incorporation protein HypA/HybF